MNKSIIESLFKTETYRIIYPNKISKMIGTNPDKNFKTIRIDAQYRKQVSDRKKIIGKK